MKNTVIIKGNRYGISIVLDKEVAFSQLLKDLELRLEGAEDFFDSDKQLAVTFEGRALSNDELDEVLSVIKGCSRLNIQYVMDENSELETTFFDIIQTAKDSEEDSLDSDSKTETFEEPVEISGILSSIQSDNIQSKESVDKNLVEQQPGNGMFYRGTLRSGQTLESKESIVIIGDVNPGASVIAGGNIVVIGSLKGTASAGIRNNPEAFVMALVMEPIQIQIADIIARSSDTKSHFKKKQEPMIATIQEHQICMEAVSRSSINDIK